jgi:hypothetical protein
MHGTFLPYERGMANHTPQSELTALPMPSWLARAVEDRVKGNDAASVLLRLGSDAVTTRTIDAAMRFVVQARRLAADDAIQALLALAESRGAGLASLAVALRFRGPEVLGPVLQRLHRADDIAARRVYLQLAVALAKFDEMRQPLVTRLLHDLDSREWYVVRNAIGLLSDVAGDVPARHDLATHANRQVRLALAKALARRVRDMAALDTLIFLLGDPDASVRYLAVVALGAADTPRARMALSNHAASETDPETLQACRVIIHRGGGQRRIA